MKSTKKLWLFTLFAILLLTLSACGGQTVAEAEAAANAAEGGAAEEGAVEEAAPAEVDPAAIFTSAAQTVAAQLTETAIHFSPTPAPATATVTMIPPTATLVNLNNTALPTLISTVPTLAAGLPTLIPTATQALATVPDGPICDAMLYGSPLDITIPDGSTIQPGADFEKIWRIQNNGVCPWDDGYSLVPVASNSTRPGDNNPLDAANPAWQLKTLISPGEVVDVGAKLTAPAQVGVYETCFMMENDRGVLFGGVLCVDIVVKSD